MEYPNKIFNGIKSSIQIIITVCILLVIISFSLGGTVLFGYTLLNVNDIDTDNEASIELVQVSGSEGAVDVDSIYQYDDLSQSEQEYLSKADTNNDEVNINSSNMSSDLFEEEQNIGVYKDESVHVYQVELIENSKVMNVFVSAIVLIMGLCISLLIFMLIVIGKDTVFLYEPVVSKTLDYV